MQLPTLSSVRVVPVTAHTLGVLEASTTDRPDVELATRAAGVLARTWLPGEMKVMVCAAATTVKVLETTAAASKLALPAWLALMLQLPTVTSVRAAPLTVQTAGVLEANVTVKPDVALATKGTGVGLNV